MIPLLIALLLFQVNPEANGPAYWCGEDGVKYEPVDTPFIVPEPEEGTTWTLLVLKGGTTNEVIPLPVVGQGYSHSVSANSHVILCWDATDPTTTTTTTPTTTAPTTSTTTTSTTTVTSTVPGTTTTDPTVPSSSTSTPTPEVTTTVTDSDPSTTTTSSATSTSVPPTTTTTIPTLPMTGFDMTVAALLVVALFSLGTLAIIASRRAE